jgi:exodeoxyribonuclease-3
VRYNARQEVAMKLVSFNVNGIRARLHQVQAVIDQHAPDLIGVQESKVQDAEFPAEAIEEMGYHPYFHGQKGHYGVALLTRKPLDHVMRGFPEDDEDAQKRLIVGQLTTASGDTVTVFNGYFPNGENREHPKKFPAKEKFYAELYHYLRSHHDAGQNLVVMGDFNISPTDRDIGIGEQNRKRWLREGKCSFLPEEREWFQRMLDWGLHDTFREHQPEEDNRFSWFDYRSRGFERDPKRGLRIDGILATAPLLQQLSESWIDYDIRGMEKPSDHCPVWASFRD